MGQAIVCSGSEVDSSATSPTGIVSSEHSILLAIVLTLMVKLPEVSGSCGWSARDWGG